MRRLGSFPQSQGSVCRLLLMPVSSEHWRLCLPLPRINDPRAPRPRGEERPVSISQALRQCCRIQQPQRPSTPCCDPCHSLYIQKEATGPQSWGCLIWNQGFPRRSRASWGGVLLWSSRPSRASGTLSPASGPGSSGEHGLSLLGFLEAKLPGFTSQLCYVMAL